MDSTLNYKQQQKELEGKISVISKSIHALAYSRLAVFIIAALLIWAFFNQEYLALIIIFVLAAVCFLVIVKKQVNQQNVLNFLKVKLRLIENEINIQNDIPNIYDNGSTFYSAEHFYTSDLDIFGKQSLFAKINRCATQNGLNILASWLKKPSKQQLIEERQIAIEELTTYSAELLDFRTRLFPLPHDKVRMLEQFFSSKLNEKLNFLNSQRVRVFVSGFSLINIFLLFAALIFESVFWSLLGIALLLSSIGYLLYKKRIDVIHEQIDKSVEILESYADNINWLTNTNWQSNLLKEKVSKLTVDVSLSKEIKKLSSIVVSLNARLNPIVGLFLNLFFQWDLRCLAKLSRWNIKNNGLINSSLDVVSEFEALISLAVLSANHPHWVKPIVKDNFGFSATNLGHPLINETERVCNDYFLQDVITVDIITGSNMAGKSTFLRTLGINMVLAFSGAKVCANSFESSIFQILSYMRIKDSLQKQTSTFKAEIDRLKVILDYTSSNRNSFVLIDEMLRGTNSRDKYLGSKVFIEKLIEQQTPGIVATHDLQIAELEKIHPRQVRNYHFDIQILSDEMFFDYKIKEGECKTFNAAILLKNIGLEIKE